MSTYTLSGTGIQALSANVTAFHVTITTLPASYGQGRANPNNYYDVALLRCGDGTGFWEPWGVVGGPQWMPVPAGTTQLGYAVLGSAVITVVEVIGGTPPFGGGSTALAGLSDVSLSSPANGQVLEYVASASKWENISLPAATVYLFTALVLVEHHITSGAAGNFGSGAWQTRPFNTIVQDDTGVVTLSSNQIHLPAGTYDCEIGSPACQVNYHTSRLQNITDSTTTLWGSAEYAGTTSQTTSWIRGRFTTTATKVFEVQHKCSRTENTDGLGVGLEGITDPTYAVAGSAKFYKH